MYEDAVDLAGYQLLAITAAWIALDRGEVAPALERWDPIARLAAPTGQKVWRAATSMFHGLIAGPRSGDWAPRRRYLGYSAFESQRCGYRPFVFDRHRIDDAHTTLREVLGHEAFSDAFAVGTSTRTTSYRSIERHRATCDGPKSAVRRGLACGSCLLAWALIVRARGHFGVASDGGGCLHGQETEVPSSTSALVALVS